VTHYGDRRLEFPIIQDHENVGTIAEIAGDGRYTDFAGVSLRVVGDRVVVVRMSFCRQGYYCVAANA
jgi:D-arabinose 1-dehydrogenase-like Zn-dependent alcohol dehydrogenase